MKTDIQTFLQQLIEAQNQMLDVLSRKQSVLVKPEKTMLAAVSAEEEQTLVKLQQVLERREEILTSARLQNISGDSIEQLCGHFFPHNIEVQKVLDEIKHRIHRIRLLAYTNWTMSRKSLIHISQILELLETQGKGKTTYQPQQREMRLGFVDKVA